MIRRLSLVSPSGELVDAQLVVCDVMTGEMPLGREDGMVSLARCSVAAAAPQLHALPIHCDIMAIMRKRLLNRKSRRPMNERRLHDPRLVVQGGACQNGGCGSEISVGGSAVARNSEEYVVCV